MGRSAVKCGQGRSVWGLGRGPDNTCKLLTIVFGPQYLLHNYYPLTSLFPFPSGQIIFPPWFILSLGSEHQEIPEWRSGRELRGTRCEFYPRQNLSRLWGSRIVRLSPISNSGSLSPPWACGWSLSGLLHPAPSITWERQEASSLGVCVFSICKYWPMWGHQLFMPARKDASSFPVTLGPPSHWSAPEPNGQRHLWPKVHSRVSRGG